MVSHGWGWMSSAWLWLIGHRLFLSSGFGYELLRLQGSQGFCSMTLYLHKIVPWMHCTYVGWPAAQSLGLWFSGSRGNRLCLQETCSCIIHAHTRKKKVLHSIIRWYESLSTHTNTHKTTYAQALIFKHMVKSTGWLIEYHRSEDSVWEDESQMGGVGRKQEGGGGMVIGPSAFGYWIDRWAGGGSRFLPEFRWP